MRAHENDVLVLTYHSISAGQGPTSIPRDTFRMQMDVLAESGYRSMSCQEFLDWRRGSDVAGAPRVLITFDDGFADFATEAFPILGEHAFSSIVFVPTGKLGGCEDWPGANASPRPLMSWSTVGDMATAGVEFGGHGVSHTDLTRLAPELRRYEIEGCARDLAERIGRPVRSFAAPYGHVDRAVRADLARTYEVAFGTRLDRAERSCDVFDVPRIEMHYFRAPRRWRAFLQGERTYFLARRALRAVRAAATRLSDVGGAQRFGEIRR